MFAFRSLSSSAKDADAASEGSLNTKWVPINHSFIVLAKIILRAALVRRGLVNAAITLRCVSHQGYRHLVLVDDEQDIQVAAMGCVEEFIISTETSMTPSAQQLSSADSITLPIDYRHSRVGYLVALADKRVVNIDDGAPVKSAEAVTEELVAVVGEIVDVIKRYETRHRAWYIYGDQDYWIGNSEALRLLNRNIELLAKSSKPVLIRANKGTGKMIAARSLHCYRHTELAPFYEADCADWSDDNAAQILQTMAHYGRGDTLFLRNIDQLSVVNFLALMKFYSAQGKNHRVNLILSFSERNPIISSEMFEWLAANTHQLLLPDLLERAEDVRDLAQYFMHEFELGVEFDFSEDAWLLLEKFHWKNNVQELKELIYRVALTVEKPIVPTSTLASLILPQ